MLGPLIAGTFVWGFKKKKLKRNFKKPLTNKGFDRDKIK